MGFSTAYLGRLTISPPLNDAEVDWLRAFAAIDRRHYHHPYDVAMNPRVVQQDEANRARGGRDAPDPFATLTPRDGSPYPHLDWGPCMDGCCLEWTRQEKSRMAPEWIEYLIDHFLRPGANAQSSDRPEFEHFTFDHQLNGTLAGERDDSRELFLIVVRDNALRVETLVEPDPSAVY